MRRPDGGRYLPTWGRHLPGAARRPRPRPSFGRMQRPGCDDSGPYAMGDSGTDLSNRPPRDAETATP